MIRRPSVPPVAALAALVVAAVASGGCFLEHRTPGEKIYRSRCASCHGLDARGNTPGYMGDANADISDNSWHVAGGDDAALESVIREGVFAKMPANPDLTTEEMRDLIHHLRRLRGEAQE